MYVFSGKQRTKSRIFDGNKNKNRVCEKREEIKNLDRRDHAQRVHENAIRGAHAPGRGGGGGSWETGARLLPDRRPP